MRKFFTFCPCFQSSFFVEWRASQVLGQLKALYFTNKQRGQTVNEGFYTVMSYIVLILA